MLVTRLSDLRTDNRISPLNIDRSQPVFSWRAENAGTNWRQLTYRVRVACAGRTVWDSGEVPSARMNQVVYEGEPLTSETAYTWTLRVTAVSDGGAEALESGAACFETAMLSPADWRGVWIGEAQDEVYHLYRRVFRARAGVKAARLSICGLGHQVTLMNGSPVTDAVLEAGWTDYRKSALYATYDVTDLVREGSNALCVKLGDGMYNVRGGRYVYYPRSYGRRKLLVQLRLDYADGTREWIVTDEAWQEGPSPIAFCCIYGGEDYDGRVPFSAASLPDFDASAWTPCGVVDAPALTLRAQAIPREKVMQRYAPVSVTHLADGRDLYDLGTNFSGWVRIRVRTDGRMAGRRIVMTPGELLGADGLPDQRVTGRGYAWTCILNDEPAQEFAPDFTYTGFRYVLVEGAAAPGGEIADRPVLEALTGEFIYPELEETGGFSCSNELFNRIHQLIRQAMLSNIKSYFTDCPHREKLPWLEETHLIGPAMLCSWDLQTLYEKVGQDLADSQREDGLVADICPEYVTGFGKWHMGFVDSPEWGSACVLNPWHLYCKYGSERALRDAYPTMKRYVDYLTSRTHHGLLHHGLGDWLDIGPCTPYSQNTPIPVTATAIYYIDLGVMVKTARLLGLTGDAAVYERLRETVFAEYNAQLLDDQTGRYANGSQAAQAMSLMAGLVPEDIREKAVDQLKNEVVRRGYAITAGDVGHPYLVAALMNNGMSDVLNAMTGITETPGYGYQAVNGATTLTEEWDGPDPKKPHGSQNHLMLGSLDEWFFSGLGGIGSIRVHERFDEVTVAPHFAAGMTECRAWMQHPYGPLAVEWTRREGGVRLTVTVPPNITAHIRTEEGQVDARVGSGTWTYETNEEAQA